jgi:hypothetical protein
MITLYDICVLRALIEQPLELLSGARYWPVYTAVSLIHIHISKGFSSSVYSEVEV